MTRSGVLAALEFDTQKATFDRVLYHCDTT